MGERYISADVRRFLRQEVNFCCPVPGCGSPFLSYHHFDPPYHEGGTHKPQGMIALCLPHHKNADIGIYTQDQLREFKQNPSFTGQTVNGRIEWMRKELLFRSGGITAYRIGRLLTIRKEPIIWVNRSEEGHLLINMDLPKRDGSSLLKIVDNEWILSGPLSDLEAVPSGRGITVSSKQDEFALSLSFRDMTEDMLRSDIENDILEMENYIRNMRGLPDILSVSENLVDDKLKGISGDHPFIWPALEVNLRLNLKYPLEITITDKQFTVETVTFKRSTTHSAGLGAIWIN